MANTEVLEVCALHARDGMMVDLRMKIYMRRTRLLQAAVLRRGRVQPTFGVAGTKAAKFCCRHAEPGMVCLRRTHCKHRRCTTQPNFGSAGAKHPEFCAKHANQGMVNVRSKRCMHPGCAKQPSHGAPGGSKKREFCSEHAPPGTTNVRSPRCLEPGLHAPPELRRPRRGAEVVLRGARQARHGEQRQEASRVSPEARAAGCCSEEQARPAPSAIVASAGGSGDG